MFEKKENSQVSMGVIVLVFLIGFFTAIGFKNAGWL